MPRRSLQHFRTPKNATLPLLSLGLAMMLLYLEPFSRWDARIYDRQFDIWSRPAPDDVVIIAIDSPSLAVLGDWPWSRDMHAELLDFLTAAGSKVVGFNLIFSENLKGDAQEDARLVDAVTRHGAVVFPILHDQERLGELSALDTQYPALADAAAALGHGSLELDQDGIVRTVHLKGGIGGTNWSSFPLAILEVAEPGIWEGAVVQGNENQEAVGAVDWYGREPINISYAGPPGHFPRISYADVLHQKVSAAAFGGKWVLVGVTAPSLRDNLPTPLSWEGQPMPSVEIAANVLDTLRQDRWSVTMPKPWQYGLTALLVLIPSLLYFRVRPGWGLVVFLGVCLLTVTLSFALLRFGKLWFPPAATLTTLLVAYLLWSWRRLQQFVGYLDQELQRLHAEPKRLPGAGHPPFDAALAFLQQVLPVSAGTLHDDSGSEIQHWKVSGEAGGPPDGASNGQPRSLEFRSPGGGGVAIDWQSGAEPNAVARSILEGLATVFEEPQPRAPVGHDGWIQVRLDRVREATRRLRFLRIFIADSAAQMANGLVVVSSLGRVLMANPAAARYFACASLQQVEGQAIDTLVNRLQFETAGAWTKALRIALLNRRRTHLPARGLEGQDLLLQLAPFDPEHSDEIGFILNLVDVSELRESERRRGELLSFLSHDLRAPLISMLAITRLLALKPEKVADGEHVGRIESHARKTLEMADDLLQLARVEGPESIELNSVDLTAVAESAVERVADMAAARGIQIVTRFRGDSIEVKADADLLERMFVNLLTNAVKYSPEASRVELRIESKGEVCECEVIDFGYGIPEEELATLFDRFRRGNLDTHRREHGAGLGLAFVKSVVARHGGNAEVESELGAGSRFKITLPMSHESEPVSTL